jgi:hypothetical protein
VGKIELDNIRERTTAMRRDYARKGKEMNGSVRYGYRIGAANEPEIDPDEAEVLLEAARRYAAGETIAAICQAFRRRGVPTRAPHSRRHPFAWPDAYLAELLADEAYASGERTFGGEPIAYPPLFPAELWDAMRARRALNAYRWKRNTRVEYLLRHLLWCRECGLRFTGRTQRYSYGQPRADGRRVR